MLQQRCRKIGKLLVQSNRIQEYSDGKDLEIIKIFEIIEISNLGQLKQFIVMIAKNYKLRI